MDEVYKIIFSKEGIPGNDEAVSHYVLKEKKTNKELDAGAHIIVINCTHPDFPEEYKKLQLLAQDMMEPDTNKIHTKEIKKVYEEINKNEGDDIEKPFYEKFHDLRKELNEVKEECQKSEESLQQMDKTIEQLNRTIKDKVNAINEKNNIIDKKDTEIQELRNILIQNGITIPE